ncbi:uncharacterized protein [Anabrus simplex]|uniref:uncharacterized protein isoform X1 n=1 Tax=Anabrus simplex TaxID=316456 RepID=UPI0035A39405
MGSLQVLSTEEWLTAVRKRLGTADCEVLDVTVNKLGGDVSGFLGEHLQAKVSVIARCEKQELAFFVKVIPHGDSNQKHNEFVLSSQGFPKETGLYSRVLHLYPDSEVAWGPRCYFTRPDLLVLEDLIKQKFRILGRFTYLDYSHCALLLRSLAVFHAGSIILEEKRAKISGEKYKLNELYPDLLFENLFVDDERFKFNEWYHSVVESLTSALSLLEIYGSKVDVRKINTPAFKEFLYQIFELIKPSRKYKNVLSHGDLWTNNILYKYDEEDDKTPVDVRMVDFQLARYTPPAVDVMSFLHLNTTREFRKTHKYQLLSEYHTSLREELSRHGYKVEHLLPWTEFKQSCHVYKTVGCIIAPSYHHINTMSQEVLDQYLNESNAFDGFFLVNRIKQMAACCEIDNYYRERLVAELGELAELILRKQDGKTTKLPNT